MKTLLALLAICALGIDAPLFAAEAPKDSERELQQLAGLTKEVQTQQTAIAENQKKIDEKTAAIGEALRLARIYAGRGK
jgi:Fic family protein